MYGIPKWFALLLLFLGACGFTSGLFQRSVVEALVGLLVAGAASAWVWFSIPAEGAKPS